MLHYISRTFVIDVSSLVHMYDVTSQLFGRSSASYLLTRIGSRCVQLYIIIGWFNYITDSPKTSLAYGTVSTTFCTQGCVRAVDITVQTEPLRRTL